MQVLVETLATKLNTAFEGKTVGHGGHFGSALAKGPFTIHTYFHQWQQVVHPSIHLQVIDEVYSGDPLMEDINIVMGLDIRITINQKDHGWSILSVLHEEMRLFLDQKMYKLTPAATGNPATDYTYLATMTVKQTNHVYDGDEYSVHLIVGISYIRQ